MYLDSPGLISCNTHTIFMTDDSSRARGNTKTMPALDLRKQHMQRIRLDILTCRCKTAFESNMPTSRRNKQAINMV